TYTGTSLAQVGGVPYCSTNTQTVSVNQTAVFTASGGNGNYSWSTDNQGISNSNGTQISVSYPSSGTYTIHVMSNGQSNNCYLTVVPGSNQNNVSNNYYPNNNNYPNNYYNSSGSLACLPASQNVSAGQTAYLTGTGGNGTYSWIAPELSLNNPYGTGLNVTYGTPGTRIVTITSGGASATCAINVTGSSYIPTYVPTVYVPSLPNTGGGYGRR
ncbi:MAG: hypothetical protein JWL88_401, partial [Parcubacteria group bacterium]|nr:hypothetical protein [Parcubacteria group bacterium]